MHVSQGAVADIVIIINYYKWGLIGVLSFKAYKRHEENKSNLTIKCLWIKI